MKNTVKAKPAKRAPARKATVKKTKEVSARETVLTIVKRSSKGVDIATLMKKTGFKNRKVRDALYTLKKQGCLCKSMTLAVLRGDSGVRGLALGDG